jgi:hypothetical protein
MKNISEAMESDEASTEREMVELLRKRGYAIFAPSEVSNAPQAGDAVPTIFSYEAMESAAIIDDTVAKFMAEIGGWRINNTGSLLRTTAKVVQWAINRTREREAGERRTQ